MVEREPDIDPRTRESLEALLNTPVGRRWVLKAGLASAAAVGAVPFLGSSARAATARAATRASANVSRAPLQFALGGVSGLSDLVLQANGVDYPLIEHTTESRRALAATGGLWRKLDLTALTHYVEPVLMPADRAMLVWVVGRRGSRRVVPAVLMHCSRESALAFARATARLSPGRVGGAVVSDERVAELGIRARDLSSAHEIADFTRLVDYQTSAQGLVMLHPSVATINNDQALITRSLLDKTGEVHALGTVMRRLSSNGVDPVVMKEAKDPDGGQAVIKIPDAQTGTTVEVKLETMAYNQDKDAKPFHSAVKPALVAGIQGVRADPSLGAVIDKPLELQPPHVAAKTWTQTAGVVPKSTRYQSPRTARRATAAADTGVHVKLKNDGWVHGIMTEVTGFDAGARKVNLKVYNNFVRWASVYAQYLGKDGVNLSIKSDDQKFSFPNTKYSDYVGLLEQVPTILGIPVFGQNSIDLTLTLPYGAHTARLLYCGLGNDAIDGGWRQYFPADAYPGKIAPDIEVLLPALITGLLTIGLTVFSLAALFNIAVAWAAIRSEVAEAIDGAITLITKLYASGEFVTEDILEIFGLATKGANTVALTAGESFAVVTAVGDSKTAEIVSNGFDPNDLWKILVTLGTVIPKFLFNPAIAFTLWSRVGTLLAAQIGAESAAKAVPVIGLVLTGIAAAGDAATLAECAIETATSPWVIENEVSLTRTHEITVKPGEVGQFPPSAATWRLDTRIDGAKDSSPVTGEFTGGGVHTMPLVLEVPAPFGTGSIQFTFVIMDEEGNQLATAVSDVFDNSNPDVGGAVELVIVPVDFPITAKTEFRRAGTTAYSTADKGYVWSRDVPVSATHALGRFDNIVAASVATRLGVAGVVWKHDGKFYVRAVPTVQDEKTLELGKLQQKSYDSRPFLLLNPFVGKDQKHVLLEPDGDRYAVRMVGIDPVNGGLKWDPKVSHGAFVLPPTAAALGANGNVYVLDTNNARLGVLQPAATNPPPVASYHSGPDLENDAQSSGLLHSPIAIAATASGIVLILEAGSKPRISAFDTNADPAKYFAGASSSTLALSTDRVYLDIAVDGADKIYLLSYEGDGTKADQYKLEVRGGDGTLLNTSAGVNLAHLAIDYWRSIYGANYAPLLNLGTNDPHIDPDLGTAEPSISRFDPHNPAPTRRRARIIKGD